MPHGSRPPLCSWPRYYGRYKLFISNCSACRNVASSHVIKEQGNGIKLELYFCQNRLYINTAKFHCFRIAEKGEWPSIQFLLRCKRDVFNGEAIWEGFFFSSGEMKKRTNVFSRSYSILFESACYPIIMCIIRSYARVRFM